MQPDTEQDRSRGQRGDEPAEPNGQWEIQRQEWAKRDGLTFDVLYEHPAAACHLIELGLFGSTSSAGRWLNRQYQWQKISQPGKWKRFPAGRYLYMYCCRKLHDHFHEFAATEAVWPYLPYSQVLRTKVDPEVRPDLTFIIDYPIEKGVTYNLELDRGTMTNLDRVQARLKMHIGKCDNLLFVTTRTEQRLRNVLDIAGPVKKIFAACTLDTLLKHRTNQWQPFWQTVDEGLIPIHKVEQRAEKWRAYSRPHGGQD